MNPHHTFKAIVKLQIIKFHRNSHNKHNFNKVCSILLSALKPQGKFYTFLRKTKSETVREIENPLISTEPYKPYKIQQAKTEYQIRTIWTVIH